MKHDGFVSNNHDRRIIMITSKKIKQAVTKMTTNGVMDATLKVGC